MKNKLCEMLGCEFPLLAFSHCRDVIAAVSRAGGFGVFGVTTFSAEQLERELAWIDRALNGKPYGLDIAFAEHQELDADSTFDSLYARIPAEHKQFVKELLARYDIDFDLDRDIDPAMFPMIAPDTPDILMDVSFRHPIRLMANALGLAPPSMIERSKKAGVPVAALVGSVSHTRRQVDAGVEIIVAQGAEAGGHCGDVSTLVLTAEVLNIVDPSVPVVAAGGIMNGRQMAGCMAAGAQGVWTGSVWLSTPESETTPTFRDKMVAASSRDTLRSSARTGKLGRQLRSPWHDAWDDGPPTLPMPLMAMLTWPAFAKIDQMSETGNERAKELSTYFVGQGIGLVDGVRSASKVVQDFKEEFADAASVFVETISG